MRAIRAAAAAASIACAGAAAGCAFRSPSHSDDTPQPDAPEPDAPPPPLTCMTDPSYSDHGGHRYKVIAQDVDYDSAIDLCAADRAHLAVIDSAEENDYLKAGSNQNGAWIGLDDLTVEDAFRWITGSQSAFRAFPVGEPNNYQSQDCTLLFDNGQWDDGGCEYLRRPICECEPGYQPPPIPLCRTLPSGFVLQSGRRLFPRTMPRTWADAEADCQSIGAHLLVVGDLDENTETDLRFSGAMWIGYTDAANEGQFRWVDGSASSFNRWIGGTPTNDQADCTLLQDSGTWVDAACGESHPYVCECAAAPP